MTTETKTPKTALSEAQRARVEAIRVSREVLQDSKNGAVFAGSSGTLPEHRMPWDLIDIAHWIENGERRPGAVLAMPADADSGTAEEDSDEEDGDE